MTKINEMELMFLLEADSRMKWSDLAKHFKVSNTAVRNKVFVLVKRGAIRKFTIIPDWSKVKQ